MPPEEAVTLTVTVQLLFAAIEPPLKDTEEVVLETVPLHCDAVGVAATVKPLGNVSVKATPLRVVAFELVIVKVSVDVPPAAMGLGENDLLMLGGVRTVTVSEPVLLLSFDSVILLFGSTVAVLAKLPEELGLALNETVKLPLDPTVTLAPLALQASVPEEILQLILPELVMPVKFPAVGVPYVGPDGSGSERIVCPSANVASLAPPLLMVSVQLNVVPTVPVLPVSSVLVTVRSGWPVV